MAVFAGLLLLLGIMGLVVSIVLIGIRAFAKKGWDYKRSLILTGASVVVMIIATVVGVGTSPAGKQGYEAGKQAAQGNVTKNQTPEAKPAPVPQPSSSPVTAPTKPAVPQPPAQSPPPPKQPSWNTQDVNIETNGNMLVAAEVLKGMSAEDLKKQAQEAKAADVMKAPWKYYGKVVKLGGQVGIAQEYPPGGDVSMAFGGGEIGEIVLVNEDSTFIDYLNVGSTGDVNVGDSTVVYGLPVGHVEATNKLGGKTTELVIVGKAIEKAQQ